METVPLVDKDNPDDLIDSSAQLEGKCPIWIDLSGKKVVLAEAFRVMLRKSMLNMEKKSRLLNAFGSGSAGWSSCTGRERPSKCSTLVPVNPFCGEDAVDTTSVDTILSPSWQE